MLRRNMFVLIVLLAAAALFASLWSDQVIGQPDPASPPFGDAKAIISILEEAKGKYVTLCVDTQSYSGVYDGAIRNSVVKLSPRTKDGATKFVVLHAVTAVLISPPAE